jgi:adenylate cyclase
MREIMRAGVIGLATGGLGIMLALTPEGVSLEERFGLSWLFALRGPIEAPADVMLVTLDRRSAEQMALPEKIRDWPRSLYASLIERLADNGASAIALDLILERAREPEHDVALMRAIDRAERVILFEALDLQREPTLNRSGAPLGLVETQRVRPPLESLAAAAAGLGPFPLPIVPDRVSQAWLFQPGAGGRPTLPAVTLQRHALEAYADWLSLLRRVGAAGVEDLPVRREDLRTALEIRRMMTQLRQAFTNDLTLGQRLREGLAEIEIGLAGDEFFELRGVEVLGRAEPVGETPRTGEPHPELVPVEAAFGRKYAGGEANFVYDGGHAWLRIVPEKIVSWDFTKMQAPT